MKIKDIYKQKGNLWVSFAIAALCILVTLVATIRPQWYDAMTYSWPCEHIGSFLTGAFLHGSPELSIGGTVGHLGFNLLLILPFGLLIEKLIGSLRFLCLFGVLWLGNVAAFIGISTCLVPYSETVHLAGISGIAFSYGVMGMYILFVLWKKDKRTVLRQISFYLLCNIGVVMLAMLQPAVAGIYSMWIHLVAVGMGILCIFCYGKTIRSNLGEKMI